MIGPAARTAPEAGGRGREGGSVTLETAVALPLVAVVLLGVLQLAGVLRDQLLVQEAARVGLRVATTTVTVPPVVDAVTGSVGTRTVTTRVTPRQRRPGDTVEVVVRLQGTVGPLRYTTTGRAGGRVEPGAGP